MKNFSNLINRLFYWRDSFWFKPIPITIEAFALNANAKEISVNYRMKNSRRLLRLPLSEFEFTHFANLSNYDRYRLIKFSTLNLILKSLFEQEHCTSQQFINLLRSEFHDDHRL